MDTTYLNTTEKYQEKVTDDLQSFRRRLDKETMIKEVWEPLLYTEDAHQTCERA